MERLKIMKTFMLLLHVWNYGGETTSFVIDYNLSNSDCIELQSSWTETLGKYSHVECVVENNGHFLED